MQRRLKRVAVAAVAMMYLVLVSGALVTNTGSGRGCGNRWPLCDTAWWDAEAIIEFFAHRGLTALATLSVLALCVTAAKALTRRPLVARLIWTSVGFLVFQALLGAANVVWPQPKVLLALHFGISLISYASVVMLAVLAFREAGSQAGRLPDVPLQLRRWLWFVTGFIFVTVYLGAYLRHTGVGLACLGWPLCNGELLPRGGPAAANFLHRAAAALGLVLVSRATTLAARLDGRADVRRGVLAVLGFYLLQIASGALLPTGMYGVATLMVHSALLVAMFGVLAYLLVAIVPAGSPAMTPRRPDKPPGSLASPV